LIDLIEIYEKDRFRIESNTSPIEKVKYLMEVNDLNQSDLVPEFGSRSLVSEFPAGKRQLNISQIRKLAERFS
jgi:HTH-type transcriptional regulator/antitoxin HigA